MTTSAVVRVPPSEKRRTRYLVIGTQRSGTTVTHQVLKGHPNIAGLNDELRIIPLFTKGVSTFTFGNDLQVEKDRAFSSLFDAITLLNANEQTTAHGAKVACGSHALAKTLVTVLQDKLRDVKMLIVLRNDLVAQYGSALIGTKTGIMHSWYPGAEGRRINKIRINKYAFIAYVRSVLRVYEVLSDLKNTHDVLELAYESLLENPLDYYNRMFHFLEVPPTEPVWVKAKKLMPPPQEYIANYEANRLLLQDIKQGRVPAPVLLLSRLIGYSSWRFRRINVAMKKFLPKGFV